MASDQRATIDKLRTIHPGCETDECDRLKGYGLTQGCEGVCLRAHPDVTPEEIAMVQAEDERERGRRTARRLTRQGEPGSVMITLTIDLREGEEFRIAMDDLAVRMSRSRDLPIDPSKSEALRAAVDAGILTEDEARQKRRHIARRIGAVGSEGRHMLDRAIVGRDELCQLRLDALTIEARSYAESEADDGE